jgi:hypothetical protein
MGSAPDLLSDGWGQPCSPGGALSARGRTGRPAQRHTRPRTEDSWITPSEIRRLSL